MLLLIGDPGGGCACREFRVGNDRSFEIGAGGASGCESALLLPNGPRGSVESSTAVNRVGCASTRRGVRGPRPRGDLGALEAETGGWDDSGFVGVSVVLFSNRMTVSNTAMAYPALRKAQLEEDCYWSLTSRGHLIHSGKL